MSPPPSAARSRFRLWLERCVFALLAVVIWRTWYVAGVVFPYNTVSGSMAETVVGPHWEVVCGDCGYPFFCGADAPSDETSIVCPNCGYQSVDRSVQRVEQPGERLLIHKTAFSTRPPRRWEVVAFRPPHRADEVHIKRVVGLPEESVQIVDGDVVVDGQIQRKTLLQQRALAILVHDASYRPVLDPPPPPRWRGSQSRSRWGSAGGRFAHPATADSEPIDWLEYRHWRRVGDRVEEGPILDVCGYNQTRPRRREEYSAVADMMLSLEVLETFGQGMLVLRASDGQKEFQVRLFAGRNRYEVLEDTRPIPAAAGRLPEWTGGLRIEASLFDQQFLLAFNGRTVVTWPYHRDPGPRHPPASPLAIGSQGLGVVIREVKVYRDTYYTQPIGPGARWGLRKPVHLGEGEYFVLGDNSPISEDSRTWPNSPVLPANLLVGRPLLVHFPARWVQVSRWRFQVPVPDRIRYIR